MRALPLLLGLPAINPRRLAIGLVLLVAALALVVMAAGRLVDALEYLLLRLVDPDAAALLTALIVLAAAGLLLLLATYYMRPRPRAASAAAAGAGAEMAAQVFGMIRRNPTTAALVTLLLGFVVGAKPDARRTLSELLKATGKDGEDGKKT